MSQITWVKMLAVVAIAVGFGFMSRWMGYDEGTCYIVAMVVYFNMIG